MNGWNRKTVRLDLIFLLPFYEEVGGKQSFAAMVLIRSHIEISGHPRPTNVRLKAALMLLKLTFCRTI
jgi:hypothetical protein